jgi:hypothetical protein
MIKFELIKIDFQAKDSPKDYLKSVNFFYAGHLCFDVYEVRQCVYLLALWSLNA